MAWMMALKIFSMLWGKKDDGAPGGAKRPMPRSRKVRIAMLIPIILTSLVVLFSVLMVFAGTNSTTMEGYDVFTLNVSRIGEGLHQKIDGAVNGINFDDLHLDLVKRSVPATIPATMTTAPTTLVTMAPRSADIGDSFKSLTQEAGNGAHSAQSAARSKASSVRSKASSAANSAESSVNNGIDSVEKKLKTAVLKIVNDSFKDLISQLDLGGFYSFYLSNTCQGNYLDEDGKNVTAASGPVPAKGVKKHIDSCGKDKVINPVGIFVGFYWVGIVLAGVTLVLSFIALWKLSTRWINWTILANAGAFFVFGVASAVVHGISHGAQSLVDFLGKGIDVDGQAGAKFITMTGTITLLLLVTMIIWATIRWYLKRHPVGSGSMAKLGSIDDGRPTISRPYPRDNGGADSSYPMRPMTGMPSAPQDTYDRKAPSRSGRPGALSVEDSGMTGPPGGDLAARAAARRHGATPGGPGRPMPPADPDDFKMPYSAY